MNYKLRIKTNCYAGNFEREMCAFLTGHIGECGSGEEFVEEDVKSWFEDFISGDSDEYGCFRPVSLDEVSTNFIIHLEKPLTKELLDVIDERARMFQEKRPYEYLDKDFKYLGYHHFKEEITRYEVDL